MIHKRFTCLKSWRYKSGSVAVPQSTSVGFPAELEITRPRAYDEMERLAIEAGDEIVHLRVDGRLVAAGAAPADAGHAAARMAHPQATN
eukprot:6174571-Pleurochrysis_carterae.AAC.2